MKRFFVVFLLMMLCCSASGAFSANLAVRGNLDVYGMWSANLRDLDSEYADGDNFAVTQRMRAYFDYVANENLKAVLGLEIDTVWGKGDADWGTDIDSLGKVDFDDETVSQAEGIKIKHAYLAFTFPDTTVNVQAGLQYVAFPSVFGNPVFDDDAPALVVSAPINDMFGLTVGYSRGSDGSTSFDDGLLEDGEPADDLDMVMVAVPIPMDGLGVTPYFGYVWLGSNYDFTGQQGLETKLDLSLADDDITVWFLGANAKLKVFDPLTLAADVIYGALDSDGLESEGWYAALAATWKMDMVTATLFGTYATGLDDDEEDQSLLPVLAEDWKITPYIGGLRAFATAQDSFATKALGVGSDGTGIWTAGLILDKISFFEKLSHKFIAAYVQGTGDEGTGYFTEEDSGFELYLVNTYQIYENLAAINELGYFDGSSEEYEDSEGGELDSSYFGTLGFAYKF
jgi:hypothetical protein